MTSSIDNLSKDDLAKLQKLGCKDILSLALMTPSSYENSMLIEKLDSAPQSGALEVEITNSRAGRNKTLLLTARMLKFDMTIDLTIFNARSFQRSLFGIGKTIFIIGKLENKFGRYFMNQPKVTTSIGKISLKFKTTKLISQTIEELTQRLIIPENLSKIQLLTDVIEGIVKIFHPTIKSYNHRISIGNFEADSLLAIKYAEIFSYLKKLRGKKREFPSLSKLNSPYQPFIDSLPFKITAGQRESIEKIAKDLDRDIATKRVVMGDVGCGKTIVILSAVVMAYPKTSVLMAPTTVLANQLYMEAKKFLPKEIKVSLDRKSVV